LADSLSWRLTRALVVALVTITSLGPALSPAAAEDFSGSSRTFRVMEFNFCGTDCPYPAPAGATPDRAGGDTSAKLAELEARITSWQPNVVVLSEICLAQLERLVAELGATTWRMDSGPATASSTTYDGANPPHYVNDVPVGFVAVDHSRVSDPTRPRVGCERSTTTHARTFGNAVLAVAGAPMWNRQDIPINVDASGNPRGIQKGLCVTLSDAPYETRVCLTHTSPNPSVLAPQQIAYFFDALADGYGAGHPEIIAGDLNVRPGNVSLDRFYDPAHGGTGKYLEADECDQGRPERLKTCNENTKDNGGDGNTSLNKKIDYVFASQAFFGVDPSTTTVNRSAYSDHGIYRATMTQCSVFTTAGCGP
jgi:endonuclease/exonuclease/phosphatase family metal-dependent hydrolase